MRLVFFNHFHNGDIYHSKPFVRDLIKKSGLTETFYSHNCSPWIIRDLIEAPSIPLVNIDRNNPVALGRDVFFVNTWVGAFFGKIDWPNHTTLNFNYLMYRPVYKALGDQLGKNIELGPIEDYYPTIDYSYYQRSTVDRFVNEYTGKKVLISNGPCQSGQSIYNGDMKPIINALAQKYPNVTFIPTLKFENNLSNIIFTEDIIQSMTGSDLNEIGYLSTFCDVMVGRNSGPDCFAKNKDNLFNPNKHFYSFGDRDFDTYFYEMPVTCDYLHESWSDFDKAINSIDNMIRKL